MQQDVQEKAEGAGTEDQARAESLAAIQGQVLDAEPVEDAQGGGVSGTVAIRVSLDALQQAAEIVRFATTLFFPLYPSLERVYTEEKQARLAAAAAPLMEKYDLSMGKIFQQWGAEITFAMVALPLAGDTIKAIKADNQARKEQAEREKKEKEETANANQ